MGITEYFKKLDHPQKADLKRLHKIIREVRPKYKAKVWNYSGEMIGYGTYDYVYKTGNKGSWFIVGFAPRKGYISLYTMAARGDKYLAELSVKSFPGAKAGKSCLNIKDLSGVEDKVIKKYIKTAFDTFEKYCREQGWPYRG